MMRRALPTVAAPLAAGRAISNYGFGHPNMDVEFQDSSSYASPQPRQNVVKTSVLPNGARLITHDFGGAQASVGVFADAGPKYDPSAAPGLSYVMRWSLPTSNMANALFQIDRNMRAVGATQESREVRKQYIGWVTESPAGAWKAPAEDIFTCVSVPRFPEYDTERFRDTMDNLLQEKRWQTPREYAVDQLETVAFYREPLGMPRMVPAEHNDDASHGALLNHWSSLFHPNRVTVAGVNIDHDELAAAYENAPFPHSASAPHHANCNKLAIDTTSEATQYYPGAEKHEQESRPKEMCTKPDMDEEAIVALGFLTNGRDQGVKPYAASLVLQELMSGASDDGLRHEHHDPHHGVRTFYRPFATAGLVGVTVRQAPEAIAAATSAAAQSFLGLKPTDATVAAAKQRAKVAFYNSTLEVQRDYVEFLATSFTSNGRITSDEIVAAIDGIKTADVVAAHKAAVSKKPVMFATGETSAMPSLRQMGL